MSDSGAGGRLPSTSSPTTPIPAAVPGGDEPIESEYETGHREGYEAGTGGLAVEHEIQARMVERLGLEWPPGEPFYAIIEDEIVRLRAQMTAEHETAVAAIAGSEKEIERLRALVPKPPTAIELLDKRTTQNEARLVNMASTQEVGLLRERVSTLTVWYLIGMGLLALMLVAVILLQHYWH